MLQVSLKKALRRMRSETENMDVMIGVLQQGLLQAGLKNKDSMQTINYDY